MIADRKTTHVGKLHVRSDARDKLLLQLRLNRALSTLDLHPAGLPSSAVLFVRRLQDPAPGLVRTDDSAGVPYAWGQVVAASLSRLADRAARPALGHVGSNADAVLFIDRSELLASLAADWCDGTAITHWWWQSLFRGTDLASAVFGEWLASIDWAPGAITQLAKNRLAVRFVRTLGETRSRALLSGVIERFALVELATLIDAAPLKKAPVTTLVERASPPSNSVVDPVVAASASQSPFLEWAPETSAPDLNIEQKCLLGVAMMLIRAPSVVRSRAFARRILEWREWTHCGSGGLEQHKVPLVESQARPPGEAVSATEETGPSAPIDLPQSHSSQAEVEVETSPGSAPAAIPFSHTEANSTEAPISAARSEAINATSLAELPYDNRGSQKSTRDDSFKHSVSDPDITFAASEPDAARDLESIETETEMGGVFYLINAALYLKLYGDFTTPLEPGLPLAIWDFLALVGGELIGEKLKSDPLWQFLAKLSGRGEREPGFSFDAPDDCRLPPEWLDPFKESAVSRIYLSSGRLRVEHPAGFVLFDVDSTLEPERKLAREAEPYGYASLPACLPAAPTVTERDISGGHAGSDAYPGGHAGSDAYPGAGSDAYPGRHAGSDAYPGPGSDAYPARLERWTNFISAYLRARLVRALGLDSPSDLVSILLQRRARVVVTPARLDVTFPLAELHVQVRLSGLDRDPGWVPAAGRTITFHYE